MLTQTELEKIVVRAANHDGGLREALSHLRHLVRGRVQVKGMPVLPQRHVNAVLAYVLSHTVVIRDILDAVDAMKHDGPPWVGREETSCRH